MVFVSRLSRSNRLSALLLAGTLVMGFGVAPSAFAATDQHGEAHDPAAASGSYTIVDFAASWCGPCKRSLPRLQELAHQHPELRVLVISVDQKVQGRDELVEQLDLKVPVIWDEGFDLARIYEPKGMPETIVLDPQGKEIYRHTGFSEGKWRQFASYAAKLAAAGKKDDS